MRTETAHEHYQHHRFGRHGHGDRRPYLTALITLEEAALAAAKKAEPNAREAFAVDGPAHRLVAEGVARANAKLAKYETIKAFRVLTEDFTVENGALVITDKQSSGDAPKPPTGLGGSPPGGSGGMRRAF